MRNFLQLFQGVDPTLLLLNLKKQEHLWNKFPVRVLHENTKYDDIIIRYNRWNKDEDITEKVGANTQCVNYPYYDLLPEVRQLTAALMARVQGETLGRVFLFRLAPGQFIPARNDRDLLAEEKFPNNEPPSLFYDRYHFVVNSTAGVTFMCGNEQVCMESGSVWWFNHNLDYAITNASADDCVHLVVDIAGGKCNYFPN